jgi:hypothetical protein
MTLDVVLSLMWIKGGRKITGLTFDLFRIYKINVIHRV